MIDCTNTENYLKNRYNFKDLTGRKFGRLTVIERSSSNKKREATWLCVCDCGNSKIVSGNQLRSGHTKSCGCLHSEVMINQNTTHGKSYTRIYRIWRSMIKRCYYPSYEHYGIYGGRGIKVCDDWKNSFEVFDKWAMANGYAENLTIDRIDANKDYCPSNCRWVTMKEQGNNRSTNVNLTLNGETHNIKQWSEMFGISYGTVWSRLKRGWSLEKALQTV